MCGTAHHKVRLYDVESQKRPVVQVSWLDARVTAMSPSLQQGITWVANAKGFIQVLPSFNNCFMDSVSVVVPLY